MRRNIKKVLYKVAPALAFTISALRYRRTQWRKSSVLRKVARKELFDDGQPCVISGPLAGMRYIDEFTFGPIVPRWMGTYEPQLHSWIGHVLEGSYDAFIDIGAAEGYYAVGIARRRPDLQVITFEADLFSRRAQRRLAALNQVNNLRIESVCNHERLEHVLSLHPFVLCDIEGGEFELIDPARCPGLGRADLVIEIHPLENYSVMEVAKIIANRFEITHTAQTVTDDDGLRRNLLRLLRVQGLKTPQLDEFACEQRPSSNLWLALVKNDGVLALRRSLKIQLKHKRSVPRSAERARVQKGAFALPNEGFAL